MRLQARSSLASLGRRTLLVGLKGILIDFGTKYELTLRSFPLGRSEQVRLTRYFVVWRKKYTKASYPISDNDCANTRKDCPGYLRSSQDTLSAKSSRA